MEMTVFMTDGEITRLLRSFNPRMTNGIMYSAVIRLMGFCGLRASEVIGHEKREGGGLRIRDIDLTSGEVTIRDAKDTRAKEKRQKKNKTGRVVFAQGETLEAMRTWWTKTRYSLPGQDPEDYFFCNRFGGKINNSQLRRAFRIYGAKAGIPQEKRHPHALRHSAGTRFYKITKDLLITQKILGHANAHETVRYAHVSGADIEETMKRVLGRIESTQIL
ncbi:MAG: tyrosine-type recombinase/integrase [Brevinematales bacterium]|jgi:integrase